jgi:hypothetical protein
MMRRILVAVTIAIALGNNAAAQAAPNPDPAHVTRPDGSPAQAQDPIICLRPRNDPVWDGDNIQWSIDNVRERGTLLLGAGTFRVGRTGAAEDFAVTTARGEFRFIAEFYSGFFGGFFADEAAILDQHVNVHKPVTIRGATGPGSIAKPDGKMLPDLLTTIAVPEGLEWQNVHPQAPVRELYSGYGGSFVLNATDIAIDGIRFESFNVALFSFFPRFDISRCEFRRCAFPAYLLPDGDEVGASAFHDGLVTGFVVGLHIVGSDVTVADTHFSAADSFSAIANLPWTQFSSLPIHWEAASRNTIARNSFHTTNRIGWIAAGMGTVDLTGWSGPGGATNNVLSSNEFLDDGAGAPSIALAGPGADRNSLIANDFTRTAASGWGDGAGSVWIDPFSVENFVVEHRFPSGTDLCDQVADADDFDGPLLRRDRSTGIFFDLRTEGLVMVGGVPTPLGTVLPVYGAASSYVEAGNAYYVREQRVVMSPYSSQVFRPFLPVFGPVVIPKNTRIPGWQGVCGQ